MLRVWVLAGLPFEKGLRAYEVPRILEAFKKLQVKEPDQFFKKMCQDAFAHGRLSVCADIKVIHAIVRALCHVGAHDLLLSQTLFPAAVAANQAVSSGDRVFCCKISKKAVPPLSPYQKLSTNVLSNVRAPCTQRARPQKHLARQQAQFQRLDKAGTLSKNLEALLRVSDRKGCRV